MADRFNVMQELYDSEINAAVSSFWDGGFDAKLGDDMNGFKADACLENWDDVETWLAETAVEHYPQSQFAERWKARKSG